MNEMKAKALEKLMMVLDEILGEDVAGRLKEKIGEPAEEGPKHEAAEGEKAEKVEDVLESAMGEESPGEHGKPKGVGMEVSKVEVAAMPRVGLMKRMHGGKKPA